MIINKVAVLGASLTVEGCGLAYSEIEGNFAPGESTEAYKQAVADAYHQVERVGYRAKSTARTARRAMKGPTFRSSLFKSAK